MESLSSDHAVYSVVLWRLTTSYTASVVLGYLLMVLLANKLKELYNPWKIRWTVLVTHNAICVTLAGFSGLCLAVGLHELSGKQIFKVTSITSGSGYTQLGLWLFLVSKYYEFLDTVFMLMKHNLKQVSFLHVFYHASIPLLADYAYHYAVWPPIAVCFATNSIVHVIIYGYYCLTAWKRDLFKPFEHFFSFKKLLMRIQMFQFVLGVLFGLYGYQYEGYCVYSFIYPLGLLAVFGYYYYKAFMAAGNIKLVNTNRSKLTV